MRHVGRLRRPRHASCADACPTGKPTAFVAVTSPWRSSTVIGQPLVIE